MDIQPQAATQSISDDQELAKALAGVSADEPEPVTALQFEETPVASSTAVGAVSEPVLPTPLPATLLADGLDGIKQTAIEELRPLIGKVDLPADEKFDVYLLLIRSTDDKSLIGPAHEAAAAITDETKKAQALLDIIKEIDYLSRQDKV